MLSASDLIAFEHDIAACFRCGEIRAPIHLGGGNEKQLIDIFADIRPYDWVLAGWRAHYHCLLKGVPPAELKAAILAGRSVSLCFPQQKILCSGIVGGIAPIATGIAWSLKKRADADPTGNGSMARVFCFLGDMSARAGIVYEAMQYAVGHDLPVEWIVEDNGISVCTNTEESWGAMIWVPEILPYRSYSYKLTRPHAGIGEWVQFT